SNSPVETNTEASGSASVDNPRSGASFSYSWSVSGPSGFSTSGTGADYSFTPTQAGSYSVSFEVTDDNHPGDSGSGEATINAEDTLTVTIDQSDPQSATVGTGISL